MSENLTLRPIGRIRTEFPEKFGIPRQSGLVEELRAVVEFEREFRAPEAFRGLEGFSHLWLLWHFTQSQGWSPTVRPPRLGGNQRVGVFATRSPFRPNPIGLSCVKLEKVDYTAPGGPVLLVRGADLLDGTPIFDVKPYVPLADCRPQAVGAFRTSTGRTAFLWTSRRRCWSRWRRKSVGPCWVCLPRTPGPLTSTTPSGCTAWPLPGWRCASPWRAIS